MNKKSIVAILVLLLAVAAVFDKKRTVPVNAPTPEADSADGNIPSKITSRLQETKRPDGSAQAQLVYFDANGTQQTEDLSAQEKSVVTLAQAFLKFTEEKHGDKEGFIRFLESMNLRPVVAEDRQRYIEDMSVIRTELNLPGTRYVHAQWDGEIGGEQELQHFSFEIPKGAGALQRAKDLLMKSLPLPEASTRTEPNFVLFKHNGYVIWARQLTWTFMQGHSFNAYDKSDEGNIRIAIERDPHPQEELASAAQHGH